MSAESFLLYYGLRFHVTDEDIEPLESSTHPWQVAAEESGLDTWWGNFATDGGEEYYLFIGKQLGIFGGEYSDSFAMSDETLSQVMQDTQEKLQQAGFKEAAALLAQWEPDF
jgi:hypothetical protein